MYFVHLRDWQFPVGSLIDWNLQRGLSAEPFYVYTVWGARIGNASPDFTPGSGCMEGSHLNLAFFSNHSWGYQYEWWGCFDNGYPKYWQYASPNHVEISAHLHNRGGGCTDLPQEAVWDLAYLGGGRTSYQMADNPNYTTH